MRPTFTPGQWVAIFDGKTLDGWKVFEDEEFPDMYGKVRVENGNMILGAGSPMTGVAWTRDIPRDSYEVALEGMRVEGSDFFCGMTFPVGDSYLTWINGGWGGGVVGLSNIDNYSAAENMTTNFVNFENERWYRLRLRVIPERIEAWIDDEKLIDFEREEHEFDIWPEQEPARPFGITTYGTEGALRRISVKSLETAS